MWRETFSAGHQEKEALGASLSCTGAAEQKLRRSWGGRLFRGAILLAWLELCEICSGHYETFAFALQLKCGNCLSRSSAKPASSQLETTLSSSYLPDINYCSLLLASQQPAEKVWPFSKCCRNSWECHESIPVTAVERGITRRDPPKGLNINKTSDKRLEQNPKPSLPLMYQKGWKKGLGISIESPSWGHFPCTQVPSWLCSLSRWTSKHRKADDPKELVY